MYPDVQPVDALILSVSEQEKRWFLPLCGDCSQGKSISNLDVRIAGTNGDKRKALLKNQ